jgi:type II secretory pathway pseudopilin PulG
MQRDSVSQSAIRNPKSKIRRAFTLVEMLTVIGIIILLVSILLPVVGSVRTRAQAANTAALLQNIASGVQRYHADFNAYPGPIHNGQINGGPPTLSITGRNLPAGSSLDPTKITQSENLVLGLLGGMIREGAGLIYDANLVGNGPVSLNSLNPKKYQAYMDKTNLSAGDFKDDVADADDSAIPEYQDTFPDPMPVLYLRAKAGASGGTGTGGSSTSEVGLVTNTTNYAQQGQYDLNQIIAYTNKNIGVGKDLPAQTEYVGLGVNYATNKHGLRTANRAAAFTTPVPPGGQFGTTYTYPYDLYAYLRHPSIPNTVRNKDAFILISAGPDRVYGTRDDIQQPPFK